MAEEINFDEIFGPGSQLTGITPENKSVKEPVSDEPTVAFNTADIPPVVSQEAPAKTPAPRKTEQPSTKPEAQQSAQRANNAAAVKKPAAQKNAPAQPAKKAPEKKAVPQQKEKHKGGGLMYFLFVISVSVILACLAWMAASDVLGLNASEHEATVTLAKSSFTEKTVKVTDENGETRTEKQLIPDLGYVADQLKDAGVIRYKWLFRLFCNFTSAADNISPGTYVLRDAYDYRALLMKMQSGSSSAVTLKITFPEGYSMEQMFRLLDEQEVCEYDDLMEAAANATFNYAFLEGIEKGDASRLEGFLFPDTYEFYKYMPAATVINKFLEGFHYKLTAEMLDWQKESGLSWQEIVTIASMIEKEAANDTDRYLIASVIYNRLEAGWPLQIDSTSLYEYPDHKGAPTAEMLAKDSPYNTRINTGLPPTAICSPGVASIKAALDPSNTDYMFYALDTATGEHHFFRTADEFDAFVASQNY